MLDTALRPDPGLALPKSLATGAAAFVLPARRALVTGRQANTHPTQYRQR